MTIRKTAIAAIAAMGLATAASAQTFSPDGPRTLTSDGDVTVTKGLTLNCQLDGTGGVTGGAARIDSLALSGQSGLFNCSSVTFSGFPYAITANSATSVTINNVVVTAITGNCAGNITGTYDQATGIASFSGAQLPASSGGSNCTLSGDIIIDPPASINP